MSHRAYILFIVLLLAGCTAPASKSTSRQSLNETRIPAVPSGEQMTSVVATTRVSVVACAQVVHGPGITGATLNAPPRDAGGCDFLVEEPSFLSGMRVCFVFPLSTPETALKQFVVGRRASFEVELPLPLSLYQDGSVHADREAGQIIYLSKDPSDLFQWK